VAAVNRLFHGNIIILGLLLKQPYLWAESCIVVVISPVRFIDVSRSHALNFFYLSGILLEIDPT